MNVLQAGTNLIERIAILELVLHSRSSMTQSPPPPPWWQFTIVDLLALTTFIAIVTGLTQIVGWQVLLVVLHPASLLLYLAIFVERCLRRRSKAQRERAAAAFAAENARARQESNPLN
jgi:hypothetical protein